MVAELARPAEPLKKHDETVALLKVSKGSWLIPLLLLGLASALFAVHGLSSTDSRVALDNIFSKACQSVRDKVKPGQPLLAKDGKPRDWSKTPISEKCATGSEPIDELLKQFKTTNLMTSNQLQAFEPDELGGMAALPVYVGAAAKDYLDALWSAGVKYWRSVVQSVLVTAAYALVPGIAGMIYRRAFWIWFGLGFAALLGINALASSLSSLFGRTPTTDPVADAAAALSMLILVQLAVLLLAFRLRRHTTKPPLITRLIPAKRFNSLLCWALILVGLDSAFHLVIPASRWDALWNLLPFDNGMEWLNFVALGLPFVYAVLKVTDTWSGARPKNIVVCLDGTSNTPDQQEMGFLSQTNVFKLFKMLKADKSGTFAPTGRFNATLCKTYDDKQIGLYFTGIGNKFDNDPVVGMLSQATGMGASGIIERAYLDVMRVWRPGDRVFIVGFSRGAASARLLSRVIDHRGAPSSIWTLQLFGRHWSFLPSRRKQPIPIDVLGCWDTVGSFGIAKTIAGINFQQLNLLHDMSIPDNVAKAYHMVALDEERQEFEPTLMEPDPIRPDRILEVWFSGTHAGVGGGFATDRLSDVPLDYLLRRVSSGYSADGKTVPGDESWGIHLSAINGIAEEAEAAASGRTTAPADKDAMRIYPDPRGQLRVWISKLYNYRPRHLPLHSVISWSVFERMKTSEPVYAPQALFDLNDALDSKRDLINDKIKKLDETKSLKAGEREAMETYADKLRLQRDESPDPMQAWQEGQRTLANSAAFATVAQLAA